MRDEDLPIEFRAEKCKAAAPYLHAKLAAVERAHSMPVSGELSLNRVAAPRHA